MFGILDDASILQLVERCKHILSGSNWIPNGFPPDEEVHFFWFLKCISFSLSSISLSMSSIPMTFYQLDNCTNAQLSSFLITGGVMFIVEIKIEMKQYLPNWRRCGWKWVCSKQFYLIVFLVTVRCNVIISWHSLGGALVLEHQSVGDPGNSPAAMVIFIHPKRWFSWLQNSADNLNFPQKDCLTTQKLSR